MYFCSTFPFVSLPLASLNISMLGWHLEIKQSKRMKLTSLAFIEVQPFEESHDHLAGIYFGTTIYVFEAATQHKSVLFQSQVDFFFFLSFSQRA